jgi:hypothetical protein
MDRFLLSRKPTVETRHPVPCGGTFSFAYPNARRRLTVPAKPCTPAVLAGALAVALGRAAAAALPPQR